MVDHWFKEVKIELSDKASVFLHKVTVSAWGTGAM